MRGIYMELTLTETALTKLKELLGEKTAIYLDFIDGDSPGYEGAISCTLAVSFRLLFVDQEESTLSFDLYQTTIDSNLGVIKAKKSSERYLESKMVLDFNKTYFRYQLRADSGIIAENVVVEKL